MPRTLNNSIYSHRDDSVHILGASRPRPDWNFQDYKCFDRTFPGKLLRFRCTYVLLRSMCFPSLSTRRHPVHTVSVLILHPILIVEIVKLCGHKTTNHHRSSADRSPRWSGSGNPRMLLVLVREFESRCSEILNFFAKKKDQLRYCERLTRVSTIRRESTREERAEVFSQ